jgi:hypothetical protein
MKTLLSLFLCLAGLLSAHAQHAIIGTPGAGRSWAIFTNGGFVFYWNTNVIATLASNGGFTIRGADNIGINVANSSGTSQGILWPDGGIGGVTFTANSQPAFNWAVGGGGDGHYKLGALSDILFGSATSVRSGSMDTRLFRGNVGLLQTTNLFAGTTTNAVPTNATTGFLYFSGMTNAPGAVPSFSGPGAIPATVSTNDGKLWIYVPSLGWKSFSPD